MGVMYQLSVRSSRKVATTASIIRTREFRGKKKTYTVKGKIPTTQMRK